MFSISLLLLGFYAQLSVAQVFGQDPQLEDQEVWCEQPKMEAARMCLDEFQPCVEPLGPHQDIMGEAKDKYCNCVHSVYECMGKADVRNCLLDDEPRAHLVVIHAEATHEPTACSNPYLLRFPNCDEGQEAQFRTCQQAVGECFNVAQTPDAKCTCGIEYTRCLPVCHFTVEDQRMIWLAIDRAKGLHGGSEESAAEADARSAAPPPAGARRKRQDEPEGLCPNLDIPYPLQYAELADAPLLESVGSVNTHNPDAQGNDDQPQDTGSDLDSAVESQPGDDDVPVAAAGRVRPHGRYQLVRHVHHHPVPQAAGVSSASVVVVLVAVCALAIGLAVRNGYDRRLLAPFTTRVTTGSDGGRRTVDASGSLGAGAGSTAYKKMAQRV